MSASSKTKLPEYRIVTDDEVFRIEINQPYTVGWFRKRVVEQWVPCDFMLNPAWDDDGYLDPIEITEYDTWREASDKISSKLKELSEYKPAIKTVIKPREWRVVTSLDITGKIS